MKFIYLFSLLFYIGQIKANEKILPVRVAMVKQAPIGEEITLTGTITTQRLSNLSSRVDALVTKILVKAGDFVNQGDTLVRLDNALARYDVMRSVAALAEAKAEWQESIRKRDELSTLIEKNYMAKTSYEAASSDVNIKQAVVKRLQANHKRDVELLNQHVIKAPYDGIISNKTIEIGQWIKVGNSVMELVDIKNLRAEVPVPQQYYSRLKKGTATIIHLDALPGQVIKANITYKIPIANNTAHSFPVHIEIENINKQFTPGMTCRVVFQVSTEDDGKTVLLVPRDAIVKQVNKTDKVWVVQKQKDISRVYPVEVKTGRIFKKNFEVLEGELKPGMELVIRGNEILKPGQQISISR